MAEKRKSNIVEYSQNGILLQQQKSTIDTDNKMGEFQNHCLKQRNQTQKSIYNTIPCIRRSKHAKLICGGGNQKSGYLWQGREGLTTRRHDRTFWHDASVPYLDWNRGYQVFVHQKSTTVLL